MEGVLYFPHIEVPGSAWFTRTLLYWDQVGTIVPGELIHEPSNLSSYLRDLVASELVRQVEPWYARFDRLRVDFMEYLHSLSLEELQARREAFSLGDYARVHRDKFLMIGADERAMAKLGLVDSEHLDNQGRYVVLKRRTAVEFMAALALALCEPGQEWQTTPEGHDLRWVPTTDVPLAAKALVDGLSQDELSQPLHLSIQGHQRTDATRVQFLQRLLPVPTDPVPVDRIVRFRQRHGDLPPQLRRYMEREVDAAVDIEDPAMRQRHLDRIGDELEQRVEDAERYMHETLRRRVAHSPLLRWAKFIPTIGRGAEAAREVAGSGLMERDFKVEPLAYLAFASTEFGAIRHRPVRIDPRTGFPYGDSPPEPAL